MHYYQHHIGDYDRDTAALSLVEHGVYGKLMRSYYSTERPLPVDMDRLCQICGAKSRPERLAVGLVAEMFFQLDGAVLRHRRIDAEISDYQKRAEINRLNGPKGGRPRNPKLTQKEPKRNPDGSLSVIENEPKTNPIQEPLILSPARGEDWPELADVIREAERVLAGPDCAEAFFNDMEGGGWVTKHGHPVSDWKPLLRNYVTRWKANEHQRKGRPGFSSQPQERPTMQL